MSESRKSIHSYNLRARTISRRSASENSNEGTSRCSPSNRRRVIQDSFQRRSVSFNLRNLRPLPRMAARLDLPKIRRGRSNGHPSHSRVFEDSNAVPNRSTYLHNLRPRPRNIESSDHFGNRNGRHNGYSSSNRRQVAGRVNGRHNRHSSSNRRQVTEHVNGRPNRRPTNRRQVTEHVNGRLNIRPTNRRQVTEHVNGRPNRRPTNRRQRLENSSGRSSRSSDFHNSWSRQQIVPQSQIFQYQNGIRSRRLSSNAGRVVEYSYGTTSTQLSFYRRQVIARSNERPNRPTYSHNLRPRPRMVARSAVFESRNERPSRRLPFNRRQVIENTNGRNSRRLRSNARLEVQFSNERRNRQQSTNRRQVIEYSNGTPNRLSYLHNLRPRPTIVARSASVEYRNRRYTGHPQSNRRSVFESSSGRADSSTPSMNLRPRNRMVSYNFTFENPNGIPRRHSSSGRRDFDSLQGRANISAQLINLRSRSGIVTRPEAFANSIRRASRSLFGYSHDIHNRSPSSNRSRGGEEHTANDSGNITDQPPASSVSSQAEALGQNSEGSAERGSCPICLDTLESSDPLSTTHNLTCGHNFHWNCISEWFRGDNYNCPICRSLADITTALRVQGFRETTENIGPFTVRVFSRD